MGKSYASELDKLGDTYDWAMKTNLDQLAAAFAVSATLPLLSVGSGGSLTVAHLASLLHQEYTGRIAKAMTPLEIGSSTASSRNVAALFLSAGGKNKDIVGAFKSVAPRELSSVIVVCFSPDSPLDRAASTYHYVDRIVLDPPSGTDGFLATNSMLALSVLLCRAYAQAFCAGRVLPDSLAKLERTRDACDKNLPKLCEPLWERETTVVLYGPSTQPAAVDLESKFTEAALGSIQIADYRNFAHGRHHWLAKRGSTSAVLALSTNDDRHIADETLGLVPDTIPVVRLNLKTEGIQASLAALVSVLRIVGVAGNARGIDPGRPGVPSFGRKIYNLSAFGTSLDRKNRVLSSEAIAIVRKTDETIDRLTERGEIGFWREAYYGFMTRLKAASFRAVALDYDGTLCDVRNRYEGPEPPVISHLQRILSAGIAIGVATGRGKSVREDLRQRLERSSWSNVLIGYYNGADVGLLADDEHPDSGDAPCEALRTISEVIQADVRVAALANCTYRSRQITLVPKWPTSGRTIRDIILPIVQGCGRQDIAVVHSGHSLDILAPGVSKRSLVNRLRDMFGAPVPAQVLCIGDRGRWPGNDFALLTEPCSLSVDEVSPDPNRCWNLARAGHRGVQATLDYLASLEPDGTLARLDLGKLGHRAKR